MRTQRRRSRGRSEEAEAAAWHVTPEQRNLTRRMKPWRCVSRFWAVLLTFSAWAVLHDDQFVVGGMLFAAGWVVWLLPGQILQTTAIRIGTQQRERSAFP